MTPELFGIEHILYILISTTITVVSLILAKKYAKSEKSQTIFLKAIAVCLFISILTNRLSQVFRYDDARWYLIIPDSFCGMTSLVLSLAVYLEKETTMFFILFGY